MSLQPQIKLLYLAAKNLLKVTHPQVRRKWQFQINKGRAWVHEAREKEVEARVMDI